MITFEKNGEAKLLEFLKGVGDGWSGLVVVSFLFSRVSGLYRGKNQVKIVINVIRDLFGERDGCLFLLSNSDIVLVFDRSDMNLLADVVYQVRYLFADDSIVNEPESFTKQFDLGYEADEFVDFCRSVLGVSCANVVEKADALGGRENSVSVVQLFENYVNDIDLNKYCSCRVVFLINSKGAVPVFNVAVLDYGKWLSSYSLPIAELNHTVRHRIDCKLMEHIIANADVYMSRSIMIGLSVHTILSDFFVDYSENLRRISGDVSIICELNLLDIVRDLTAFMEAKRVMHAMGLKWCICNISVTSLVDFDAPELSAHLLKINSTDLSSTGCTRNVLEMFSSFFHRKRTIFSGCDGPVSVSVGRDLGMCLFQGRYIDNVCGVKGLVSV